MAEKNYNGLSKAEVDDRVRMGKSNKMHTSASKSKKEIILEHTLTYFNFLNLFLAILVAFTGQFKNMTFMGVILINTMIGIVQELKVKKLIDQISVMTVSRTKVIREGKTETIDVENVVQDDIIFVESGQQVCADCILLESEGIEVNESMLTGESRPVKKKKGDELLSGSFLVAGNGVAKVYHVGEDNYASVLAKKAKIKKRASSEMQEAIKKIIKWDGMLLIPVGILLFLNQNALEGISRSDAICSTVAGVIGMIPEGLVLLTSVSFVLGVGRLAKKKALVQEMEAIEALARVDVLCLDKTGTITTGKLDVTEVVPLGDTTAEEAEKIMKEITWAFEDVNATQEALRKRFEKSSEWKPLRKIPFSSEWKYRAVQYEDAGYVLGAPEMIVPEETEIQEKAARYSGEGLRVILLARCQLSEEEGSHEITEPKAAALIVLSDQIRKEAIDTFEFFKKQKVAIKIISGDNPLTVSKTAEKAGVEGAEKYVDARALPTDFDKLCEVIEQTTVFGRVRPEQKQDIIKAAQQGGHVVGMVGDGVNDVLALKDSDCGIAMAAGSDAAKQVAHIVLLDSDFSSMQEIVKEGRTIISNIEKVSALYLTKTVYSILLSVIFIFWSKAYPFIPIQLSWISGVCIGIPSFLLTLEKDQNTVSDGFLRQVLRISLPAALTMVFTLCLTQVFTPFWDGLDSLTATMNLFLGGMVSLMVVYRVCQPMTKRHKAMSVSLTVIFVMGLLLMPGFFGIYPLKNWQNLFLIPMTCMVIMLNRGLTNIFGWIDNASHGGKNENNSC